MKIMRHDDFIIHQRRAKFASERRDFSLLPVEGSAAYEGRRGARAPVRLADIIGYTGLTLGFALFAYMLGRMVLASYGIGG